MDDDSRIDAYHAGWDAHAARKPRPSNPDSAMGWDDRAKGMRQVVVMPPTYEGEFHGIR